MSWTYGARPKNRGESEQRIASNLLSQTIMADGEGYNAEDTDQSKPEPTPLQWKCLDFGWLVFTWPGRFKSAEFVTTLLGFILVSSVNLFDEEPRYEFYVFVGVFTWVMVLLHMILGIPHLVEKLPAVVTQPLVFFVLCCVAVVSWLVAASVVVAKDRDKGSIQAGAAFGYMTMFLFAFETVYYFVLWRRHGPVSKRSTAKEMDQTAGDESVPYDPGY